MTQEKRTVQAEDQELEAEQTEGLRETADHVGDLSADEGEKPQMTVEDLQDQIHKLQQEAEENYNRYLRTQADFDNFRRRSRKEKEEFLQYAALPLIESLLPAFDNLERAINSSEESKNFDSLVKGVDMVFRQVNEVLSKEGLKPIEALGKPFDPHYHQAVMQEESTEHEAGIVIAELQKGYMLKDKVIRPSMVKVSS
jgi:molecular chaperone GrpE